MPQAEWIQSSLWRDDRCSPSWLPAGRYAASSIDTATLVSSFLFFFFFLPSLFPYICSFFVPTNNFLRVSPTRSDWLPRLCSSSGTGLSSRRSAPPPPVRGRFCIIPSVLPFSYYILILTSVFPVGEHLAWTLPLVRASIGCDWRAPASSVWPQIVTRIFTRLCFCILSSSHLSPLVAPFVSPFLPARASVHLVRSRPAFFKFEPHAFILSTLPRR